MVQAVLVPSPAVDIVVVAFAQVLAPNLADQIVVDHIEAAHSLVVLPNLVVASVADTALDIVGRIAVVAFVPNSVDHRIVVVHIAVARIVLVAHNLVACPNFAEAFVVDIALDIVGEIAVVAFAPSLVVAAEHTALAVGSQVALVPNPAVGIVAA